MCVYSKTENHWFAKAICPKQSQKVGTFSTPINIFKPISNHYQSNKNIVLSDCETRISIFVFYGSNIYTFNKRTFPCHTVSSTLIDIEPHPINFYQKEFKFKRQLPFIKFKLTLAEENSHRKSNMKGS